MDIKGNNVYLSVLLVCLYVCLVVRLSARNMYVCLFVTLSCLTYTTHHYEVLYLRVQGYSERYRVLVITEKNTLPNG